MNDKLYKLVTMEIILVGQWIFGSIATLTCLKRPLKVYLTKVRSIWAVCLTLASNVDNLNIKRPGEIPATKAFLVKFVLL